MEWTMEAMEKKKTKKKKKRMKPNDDVPKPRVVSPYFIPRDGNDTEKTANDARKARKRSRRDVVEARVVSPYFRKDGESGAKNPKEAVAIAMETNKKPTKRKNTDPNGVVPEASSRVVSPYFISRDGNDTEKTANDSWQARKCSRRDVVEARVVSPYFRKDGVSGAKNPEEAVAIAVETKTKRRSNKTARNDVVPGVAPRVVSPYFAGNGNHNEKKVNEVAAEKLEEKKKEKKEERERKQSPRREGMQRLEDILSRYAYKPMAKEKEKEREKEKEKEKVVEKKKEKSSRKRRKGTEEKSKKKSVVLNAAQRRHEAYKRRSPDDGINQWWKPPPSEIRLLQHDHFHDPWRVMVICILLNRTSGAQTRRVLSDFFTLCPDAKAATEVAPEEIVEVIKTLGLHYKRAIMIQRFSQEYLGESWTHVTQLHGIGKYGADAYAIFCRGNWDRVKPEDHMLNYYWEFLHSVRDTL